MSRLYLITPPSFVLADFVSQVEEAFAGGDIACLQLRLKEANDDEIIAAAKALAPIAHAHDAAFILNDRYDLVRECGADGVHLGQEDLERISGGWRVASGGKKTSKTKSHLSPVAEKDKNSPLDFVRSHLPPDAIIGVSAHASPHLAMEAGEQGADYVAFGAFFPTTSKPQDKIDKWGIPSIDLVADWATFSTLPCVAIGGMLPSNLGPLVKAGADFIAAITGVWNHPQGPKVAVAEYNKAMAEASKSN